MQAMLRPGLALYGASPFQDATAADFGLKPAMTLISTVLTVRQVGRGERVGYGGAWSAPRDSRIAIIAASMIGSSSSATLVIRSFTIRITTATILTGITRTAIILTDIIRTATDTAELDTRAGVGKGITSCTTLL